MTDQERALWIHDRLEALDECEALETEVLAQLAQGGDPDDAGVLLKRLLAQRVRFASELMTLWTEPSGTLH